MMKTFMLDSMIFDKIIDNEKLKIKILGLKHRNQIRILITHIQNDQLNKTPDVKKRGKLRDCADEICETIPTCGLVWGTSKWGGARWGSERDNEDFEKIQRGNQSHTADALIAVSAQSDADILVTEDGTLTLRFINQKTNKEVWNYQRFLEYIESL